MHIHLKYLHHKKRHNKSNNNNNINSKTCLKWAIKNRQNKGLNDKW